MSTVSAEAPAASSRAATRWFSALFVVLLALALVWPAPVLWLNAATIQAQLAIDAASFLGREAPSWDVVYWGIVGLMTLVLFHGRLDAALDTWQLFVADVRQLKQRIGAAMRRLGAIRAAVALAVAAVAVTAVWQLADMRVISDVTLVKSEFIHDCARLANRLGGGGNPPMIVLFFLFAGLALRRLDWTRLATAMALAAGIAGIVANVVKPLVGRTRPEIWLGPSHAVVAHDASFPSGHTIGAFSLAMAIVAGSRSRTLKVVAVLLACSVGAARVISLRHWPSDVVASALLGSYLGLFFGKAVVEED